MGKQIENEYMPDAVSLPGETLLDAIEELGMSQAELALRTGKTAKAINEIIKGKTAITPETAMQLERALGVPASFWNNRQRQYDEHKARLQEQRKLESQAAWVGNFPYKKMADYGWVPDTRSRLERSKNLLTYFEVASPEAFERYWGGMEVRYRKSESFRADKYALAAWLRRGEMVAKQIECRPYDPRGFKRCLKDVRALTIDPPSIFQEKLTGICRAHGVAVVFVRELPKTASGATRWLTPHKALLQLSLRYKTDDHLWFTFFHEVAHILLHQRKSIFLENGNHEGQQEEDANEFATEFLVPRSSLLEFVSTGDLSRNSIRKFAESLGVSPGIAVGQLEHFGEIPWGKYYDLKRRLKWVSQTGS
jgi:HTH-type transcriptional regulator/antitoxin HigA